MAEQRSAINPEADSPEQTKRLIDRALQTNSQQLYRAMKLAVREELASERTLADGLIEEQPESDLDAVDSPPSELSEIELQERQDEALLVLDDAVAAGEWTRDADLKLKSLLDHLPEERKIVVLSQLHTKINSQELAYSAWE